MNLDDSISAHAQWKVKLRAAIANKEQVDVAKVSADNCCPLGQWLHDEAKRKYGTLSAYQEVVQKHAVFHKEAGRVAVTINAKDFAAAESMLNAGTPYMTASIGVGAAISSFKRVIDQLR